MKNKSMLAFLFGMMLVSMAYILFLNRTVPSPVARITRDGVLLEEIELDKVSAPYSIPLEDGSGSNTVQVEQGRICISEADCPDQICVNQGWISDGTVPIVCLPHKLMIEIVGTGGELDGAAG